MGISLYQSKYFSSVSTAASIVNNYLFRVVALSLVVMTYLELVHSTY